MAVVWEPEPLPQKHSGHLPSVVSGQQELFPQNVDRTVGTVEDRVLGFRVWGPGR